MNIEQMIAYEKAKLPIPIFTERANPSFLPVHLTGGIGDVIMAVDALRVLSKDYRLLIHTPYGEALRYFYGEPIAVQEYLGLYDWWLEFDTIAKFHFADSFRGFICEPHEGLFIKQQQIFREQPYLKDLLYKYHTMYFLLAEYGKGRGWNRRQFPLGCLGYETRIPFRIKPGDDRQKIITVHDGFDVNSKSLVTKDRSTKQWNMEAWGELTHKLKQEFPKYLIIQLGSKTSRVIPGTDECMIGKTTLTQAFDLLHKSAVHIDGDSGLVHAAARLATPSVVMWGSTPPEFYGYAQNMNIRSDVCARACYGVQSTWMNDCAIGHATPLCMDEISVERVFTAAKRLICLGC